MLSTATQWDSVRRLVGLIDYHPAPAASAFTPLALELKPGAKGRIRRGLAVKYSPTSGGATVTFETLDDLDADVDLNALHPNGWNENPESLGGQTTITLEGEIAGLAIGEPVLLEQAGELKGHVIRSVSLGAGNTTIDVVPPIHSGFTAGRTVVHGNPAEILTVYGPIVAAARKVERSILLREAPAVRLDSLTIADGVRRVYRKVTRVQGGTRIKLDRDVELLTLGNGALSGALALEVKDIDGHPAVLGNFSRLRMYRVADPDTQKEYDVIDTNYVDADGTEGATSTTPRSGYTVLTLVPSGAHPQRLIVPPMSEGDYVLDVPIECRDNTKSYLSDSQGLCVSRPKAMSVGDLIAVVMGHQVSWGRLGSIRDDTTENTATLLPHGGAWSGNGGGELWMSRTRVYGQFKESARVLQHAVNSTRLTGSVLPLSGFADRLRPGRKVIVELDGQPEATVLTTIAGADQRNVVLVDQLPEGATCANVVMRANVVMAGHGERKPEAVLGSGDATQLRQTFLLRETNVAFVPDGTYPHGVRADLEVTVDGRKWTQAPTLRGRTASESVYTVQVAEDGSLALQFGDGSTGRRLPTGKNNIRVAYRAGSGLAGNVKAGSLIKLSGAHPLLVGVAQPIDAAGGNDAAGAEFLRSRAPESCLTLDRAVSTEDFAHLAAGHSSIWQARACLRASAGVRTQGMEVAVVPAEGHDFTLLRETLTRFLQARALPGIDVTVVSYSSDTIALSVAVEVDTDAFDSDAVEKKVREVLLDAFSLRRRAFGQALYLSDVYRVVEAVEGVENSQCVIDGDPLLQRRAPVAERSVVYLDSEKLSTTTLEYTP